MAQPVRYRLPDFVIEIVAAMRAVGITQHQMAEAMGVGKGAMSMWLHGQRRMARWRLQRFLGVCAALLQARRQVLVSQGGQACRRLPRTTTAQARRRAWLFGEKGV